MSLFIVSLRFYYSLLVLYVLFSVRFARNKQDRGWGKPLISKQPTIRSQQTQPKLLRCKLRTGESFTAGAWPNGSTNNSGRFVVEPAYGFGSAGTGLSTNPSTDQQCRVVNQATIDNVWGSLSNGQKNSAVYNPTASNLPSANANTLVTVADTVVFDGPSWTPSVAAITTSGSVAQVGSRALVANSNSTGNPRFEGAHYCTLVAPDFLKRVILGQVAPS